MFNLNVKLSLNFEALYIINKLKNNNYKAYVVGGYIRDNLMGLATSDIDIATNAKPNIIQSIFEGFNLVLNGIKHGTVGVVINKAVYEITTFRSDGDYDDSRRPSTVVFINSLKEDLLRRDFTINALAYDTQFGIIDYVDGYNDIINKKIACVGNPDKRFNEDALRIMRALRFSSTLGFSVELHTHKSILNNYENLNNIAIERVFLELSKLLCGKNVYNVLINYSDVFLYLIPELEPCVGFNQNSKYHYLDVWEHIAHTVNYIKPELHLRLAALLHDIGKPFCYIEDLKGGHFYGHADISFNIAKRTLKRFKVSNELLSKVLTLVKYHDVFIDDSSKHIRKLLNLLGKDMLFDVLELHKADNLAHAEPYKSNSIIEIQKIKNAIKLEIEKKNCFTLKDMAINGSDLINAGFIEGSTIGILLKECLNAIMDNKVKNIKNELLDYCFEVINNQTNV